MKKRILIIGDIDVSLKILAQKLCLEDYDIRTPPDGKTAISFLDDPFDFMIINSQMPDGSSIDVLEEAAKRALVTKVIVLTAHPSIETAIKAIVISQPVVDVGDGISIDLNRRVIKQNGCYIQLTPTENRLLKVLLENQGELLDHKRLVQLAQGYDTNEWEAPFVLRPLVSRLRRKLQRIPGLNLHIINVRGTGYMVECKPGKIGLPTNPSPI